MTSAVPTISIILPTYNRLEFLPSAIESVFAQSLTDWELIVADDGSEADTRTYLRGLEDPPRVRVLYLSHTGRPAGVRNVALRQAHGEYVAFLDSDDIWPPTKLEAQIASLRRHPTRKWSYTRFGLVDAAGNPTGSTHPRGGPAPAGWILEKLLKGETVVALSSVVVVRQLLEQLGPFDEQLLMCEDDELYFRLAAESEIDAIDETLTLKRRHRQHFGDDVTAWRDRRRVFEKMLSSGGNGRFGSLLRRLRGEMAAGLASSQVSSGKRLTAVGTLVSSARYSWPYWEWWRSAARTLAPSAVRSFVRRHRRGHSGAASL
jgi:glycosyltransferase involved in cell wall biosynthesis